MDMLYKCIECGEQEIVSEKDHRKDGRVCKKCGGYSSPVGYIGIDFANGPDKTAYVHKKKPVSEAMKCSECEQLKEDAEDKHSPPPYQKMLSSHWGPAGGPSKTSERVRTRRGVM